MSRGRASHALQLDADNPSGARAETETGEAPVRRWRPAGRRAQSLLAGIRLRIVWWFIVMLALATVGSLVLVRQVLVQRLDGRIESDLVQEVDEIRRLAAGNDPETGELFGERVERVFEVFFERNIPARHEMFLTFLDKEPHLHSPEDEPPPLDEGRAPYPLHEDRDLVNLWANAQEPDRGHVDTPAGTVEYLAVPLLVDGVPRGVFVVAAFRDLLEADTEAASLAAAGVGLVMLLVGSLLAARLADRILDPVRRVTDTARAISETDLNRRIQVEGFDEIAQLTSTFNDMLERLDRGFATQRRFIDDAGHELRTPLTVIRGHLDLMGEDPDERRHTLALVSDELDRMSRFVVDLILLARSQQPDFLRPRLVDLDDLTERMLENASSLASRDWQLDAVATQRVVVDEQRLMQAVLQLAANAASQTGQGQRVSLGSAVLDGMVRIWVRDTGPGIADDERDRIFERFHRGRPTGSGADGSGLGLSIVKAIAEAHGGRVEVDSRPGQGATFTICVPARAEGASPWRGS